MLVGEKVRMNYCRMGGGGVTYGIVNTSLSDSHLGHCSQSLVGRSAPGVLLGRQDIRLHMEPLN